MAAEHHPGNAAGVVGDRLVQVKRSGICTQHFMLRAYGMIAIAGELSLFRGVQ
jgi:hypothetical protein